MNITIYTDGSCKMSKNFIGGWASIIKYKEKEIVLSGSYRQTTNNRMELIAVIKALEYIKKPSNITIITDSLYVVNPVNKGWLLKWEFFNWKRKDGTDTINMDLWKRLLSLIRYHNVKFKWIKGHNNHPENERCNYLACKEAENLINSTDNSSYNEIHKDLVS